MADLMEEVQSILSGAGESRKPGARSEAYGPKDPADEAFELLTDHTDFITELQKGVDAISRALAGAKSQVQRLNKLGAGGSLAALDLIGLSPKKAIVDLRDLVSGAIEEIDRIVRNGSHGRGSLGRRENLQRYIGHLDAKLAVLEASDKPYMKPTPDNDYSDELLAAAQNAANYISSPSQLEIGSKVFIGSKTLYVVGTPKMVSQGFLITLGDEKDANQPGDAYTLVLPQDFDPGTDPPPAMDAPQQEVEPTAEATLSRHGRSVKLLAADIRLTEDDYGDHMYDYPDYGPAMGRIKPGDKITLAGSTATLRVIGRDASAALVQPDAMDAEMYGMFRDASRFGSVPVGQGLPSVPKANLWMPGMNPIPANQDLPGRGGKDALDVHTQAMRNGSGENTSLVGARVLNYNPHTGKYAMASGKMPGDYEMADTIQIVGHDPSLPAAVGEDMTPRRFDLALDEATGSNVIGKLRNVVESGKLMKVNGVLMDPPVAAVMLQFYGSVSEQNRERMGAMSVIEMLTVSQRMLRKLTEGRLREALVKMGPPKLDETGTRSLQGMKKLSAKNEGDLKSAIVSAAHYAKKLGETMMVWPGNSYGHGVWHVSAESKKGQYLNSINNNGPEKMASVTPQLELRWHTVDRGTKKVDDESLDEEDSGVEKKVSQSTYVISKQGGKFMVTLGDPKNAGSKMKFRGSAEEAKEWVRDNVGSKVSADHVVDTTGSKLVPGTHSKFYMNAQKKSEARCASSGLASDALGEALAGDMEQLDERTFEVKKIDREKIQAALKMVHRNEKTSTNKGGVDRAEAAKLAIKKYDLSDTETEILLNAIHVKPSEIS